MTANLKLLVGAVVFGLLLIFGFLWKHDGDAKRDGKNQILTAQITVDSIVRDSLIRRSDSLSRVTVAVTDTFTKRDTLWRRHTDTLARTVTNIVTSVVPDSAKVAQLAALVLATQAKADSAIRAAEQVAAAAAEERRGFLFERNAWQKERSDQATKITLLEKQSRHWGLGGSFGYGAMPVRMPDGTTSVKTGPVLSVAVVYRY